MPDTVPTYHLVFHDLANVVLEESYVLAINEREGAVEFALVAVLGPGHEGYRPSLLGEQYCFGRGTLIVAGAELPRLRLSGAPPAIDATGEEDLDHIDSLIPFDVEGCDSWLMNGTWGELEVDEPTIRFVLSDA